MYEWIRPEIIVPTHGERAHLIKQAEFARSLGFKKTVVPHNGSVIKLAPGKAEIINEVKTGRLVLDGSILIRDDDMAIVERRRIQSNGSLVVYVIMDDKGILLTPLNIITNGLPEKKPKELVNFIKDKIHEALELAVTKGVKDDDDLKELIRRSARKASKYYTGKETGPVTTITIIRIGKK
jgi:ribonuclease J